MSWQLHSLQTVVFYRAYVNNIWFCKSVTRSVYFHHTEEVAVKSPLIGLLRDSNVLLEALTHYKNASFPASFPVKLLSS